MIDFHKPVMLTEAVEALNVVPGKIYVDATLGGGGHTGEILAREGIVIGIDRDKAALSHVKKKFEDQIKEGRLRLISGNFADITKLLAQENIRKVWGILMDLGVSSYQIDESIRGFSFMRDEALDMRMSEEERVTAADIVNAASEEELYDIFSKYGEERKARDVARAIVAARKDGAIKTTGQLTRVILPIIPRVGDTHPATRIFQALRIAVNDELSSLRSALGLGFELLESDGRLSVITFHSLEDRIVKLFGVKVARDKKGFVVNKKPIVPGANEIASNRRARSAKLRVIEKI